MAEFLEETDVLATEEDVSNVGEGDMTSDTNEDPVRRKITSFEEEFWFMVCIYRNWRPSRPACARWRKRPRS